MPCPHTAAGRTDGPRSNHLTDAESRILPQSGGGFAQGYNAQIAVDVDSLLIVGRDVVQAANDRQQLKPMLEQLQTLPSAVGRIGTLIADTGYFSATNVDACLQAGIEPLIASGREAHHCSLWAHDAPAASEPATPVDTLRRRLRSKDGRALYAKRKCTVEPPASSSLVTMAWNIKRMFVLQGMMKEPQVQPA